MPVIRLQYSVPKSGQHVDGGCLHCEIVLYHKDRLGTAHWGGSRCRRRLDLFVMRTRQINLDRGAIAYFTVYADMSVTLLDEAIRQAEPQACTFTLALCRKNGSKTRAITSGAMPQPVSEIDSCTYCPAGTSGSDET